MSDFNESKNSELEVIQEHLELVSGKTLICSTDSAMINQLSNENLQVFSDTTYPLSDYVDNLLFTNTLSEHLLKLNQKFDTIVVQNLFDQVKHPELFLENISSILNDDGTIIGSISNFLHITNIMNLLVGRLNNEFLNNQKFYDLNRFLLFLNQNDMHITKLFRIKKEFLSDQMNLDETLIPSKLVEMFEKISDFDTLQYVFMIRKDKTISTDNLEFISQFPKNSLLPQLQEFFEKFLGLEQSVLDKDKMISGLEDSIKEQKAFTESAINEQKAFTESAINEQKAFTESALSKKDIVIQGHENSIKEQRTIIQGHENSIKELQEYIKNLEQHINELESQLRKFRFWKR